MVSTFKKLFYSTSVRLFVWSLIFVFTATSIMPSQAQAQFTISLPTPGTMVGLSSTFQPAMLKGIKVNPENPLKFDFLIDQGDEEFENIEESQEYTQLVKYFLASLTTPEGQMWVNLSPYENDRIIEESFAQTEMGRDLLAQDYLLKQVTSSLIYPDNRVGKKFWDQIYTRLYEEYGETTLPVNTFNKVWITPDFATVYESGNQAMITESRLKVLLEEDYLLQKFDQEVANEKSTKIDAHQTQIIRELVIPELEMEINEGEQFAKLRQIYQSMVLAHWFKVALNNSALGQMYVDKNKVGGLDHNQPGIKDEIYQHYLEAYKKGAYNLIREETDPFTGEEIPRKYFSGGFDDAMKATTTINRGAVPLADQAKLANANLVEAAFELDLTTGVDAESIALSITVAMAGVELENVLGKVEEVLAKEGLLPPDDPDLIGSNLSNEEVEAKKADLRVITNVFHNKNISGQANVNAEIAVVYGQLVSLQRTWDLAKSPLATVEYQNKYRRERLALALSDNAQIVSQNDLVQRYIRIVSKEGKRGKPESTNTTLDEEAIDTIVLDAVGISNKDEADADLLRDASIEAALFMNELSSFSEESTPLSTALLERIEQRFQELATELGQLANERGATGKVAEIEVDQVQVIENDAEIVVYGAYATRADTESTVAASYDPITVDNRLLKDTPSRTLLTLFEIMGDDFYAEKTFDRYRNEEEIYGTLDAMGISVQYLDRQSLSNAIQQGAMIDGMIKLAEEYVGVSVDVYEETKDPLAAALSNRLFELRETINEIIEQKLAEASTWNEFVEELLSQEGVLAEIDNDRYWDEVIVRQITNHLRNAPALFMNDAQELRHADSLGRLGFFNRLLMRLTDQLEMRLMARNFINNILMTSIILREVFNTERRFEPTPKGLGFATSAAEQMVSQSPVVISNIGVPGELELSNTASAVIPPKAGGIDLNSSLMEGPLVSLDRVLLIEDGPIPLLPVDDGLAEEFVIKKGPVDLTVFKNALRRGVYSDRSAEVYAGVYSDKDNPDQVDWTKVAAQNIRASYEGAQLALVELAENIVTTEVQLKQPFFGETADKVVSAGLKMLVMVAVFITVIATLDLLGGGSTIDGTNTPGGNNVGGDGVFLGSPGPSSIADGWIFPLIDLDVNRTSPDAAAKESLIDFIFLDEEDEEKKELLELESELNAKKARKALLDEEYKRAQANLQAARRRAAQANYGVAVLAAAEEQNEDVAAAQRNAQRELLEAEKEFERVKGERLAEQKSILVGEVEYRKKIVKSLKKSFEKSKNRAPNSPRLQRLREELAEAESALQTYEAELKEFQRLIQEAEDILDIKDEFKARAQLIEHVHDMHNRTGNIVQSDLDIAYALIDQLKSTSRQEPTAFIDLDLLEGWLNYMVFYQSSSVDREVDRQFEVAQTGVDTSSPGYDAEFHRQMIAMRVRAEMSQRMQQYLLTSLSYQLIRVIPIVSTTPESMAVENEGYTKEIALRTSTVAAITSAGIRALELQAGQLINPITKSDLNHLIEISVGDQKMSYELSVRPLPANAQSVLSGRYFKDGQARLVQDALEDKAMLIGDGVQLRYLIASTVVVAVSAWLEIQSLPSSSRINVDGPTEQVEKFEPESVLYTQTRRRRMLLKGSDALLDEADETIAEENAIGLAYTAKEALDRQLKIAEDSARFEYYTASVELKGLAEEYRQGGVEDKALKVQQGGIDFDAASLSLYREGNLIDFEVPKGFEWLLNQSIDGFVPKLIDIKSGPIQLLPFFVPLFSQGILDEMVFATA